VLLVYPPPAAPPLGESDSARLARIVKKCTNAMEQRLAGAVVAGANRHDSIENREAAGVANPHASAPPKEG
jgi:hypothetical protein